MENKTVLIWLFRKFSYQIGRFMLASIIPLSLMSVIESVALYKNVYMILLVLYIALITFAVSVYTDDFTKGMYYSIGELREVNIKNLKKNAKDNYIKNLKKNAKDN